MAVRKPNGPPIYIAAKKWDVRLWGRVALSPWVTLVDADRVADEMVGLAVQLQDILGPLRGRSGHLWVTPPESEPERGNQKK